MKTNYKSKKILKLQIKVRYNHLHFGFSNWTSLKAGLVIEYFDFFHTFCIKIPILFSLSYALDRCR
jgi:hypothetical protein